MNEVVREVMDLKQVADYTGICRSKLYEMIAVYSGPPYSLVTTGLRRVRRFRKAAVDEWLKAREVRCAEDERRLMDGRRTA